MLAARVLSNSCWGSWLSGAATHRTKEGRKKVEVGEVVQLVATILFATLTSKASVLCRIDFPRHARCHRPAKPVYPVGATCPRHDRCHRTAKPVHSVKSSKVRNRWGSCDECLAQGDRTGAAGSALRQALDVRLSTSKGDPRGRTTARTHKCTMASGVLSRQAIPTRRKNCCDGNKGAG